MTFEEAIRMSIKAYFKGKDPSNLLEAMEGEMKYSRAYFDEAEAELLGKEAAPMEEDEEGMTDGE